MLTRALNWETVSGRQIGEDVEDHQVILGDGLILAGDRRIIRRGCQRQEELGESVLFPFVGNVPWVFAGLVLASLDRLRYLGQMFRLGTRGPNVIGQLAAGTAMCPR
jgi:hypothetical protein